MEERERERERERQGQEKRDKRKKNQEVSCTAPLVIAFSDDRWAGFRLVSDGLVQLQCQSIMVG